MKMYKDATGEIFAFDEDGSQDFFIKEEFILLSDAEYSALIAPTLEELKKTSINEINSACGNAIVAGFEHNGYRYDSDLEQQVNLIGAVSVGIDMPYRCTRIADGVKDRFPHTAAEIKAVFDEGVRVKIAFISKANELKKLILSAETHEALNQIQW